MNYLLFWKLVSNAFPCSFAKHQDQNDTSTNKLSRVGGWWGVLSVNCSHYQKFFEHWYPPRLWTVIFHFTNFAYTAVSSHNDRGQESTVNLDHVQSSNYPLLCLPPVPWPWLPSSSPPDNLRIRPWWSPTKRIYSR